ncbi:hypothetical protein GQ600_24178 [Phytophthora cactorum]|nr:hypothetical protein GQ600_24178 [Phytophthora cactorum]
MGLQHGRHDQVKDRSLQRCPHYIWTRNQLQKGVMICAPCHSGTGHLPCVMNTRENEPGVEMRPEETTCLTPSSRSWWRTNKDPRTLSCATAQCFKSHGRICYRCLYHQECRCKYSTWQEPIIGKQTVADRQKEPTNYVPKETSWLQYKTPTTPSQATASPQGNLISPSSEEEEWKNGGLKAPL